MKQYCAQCGDALCQGLCSQGCPYPRGNPASALSAQPAEPKQGREWLYTEISRLREARLRKAIAWYAQENGDKRQVDEIVHAIEVSPPPLAVLPHPELDSEPKQAVAWMYKWPDRMTPEVFINRLPPHKGTQRTETPLYAAPPAQTVPREPDTPEYRGLGCCLGPK